MTALELAEALGRAIRRKGRITCGEAQEWLGALSSAGFDPRISDYAAWPSDAGKCRLLRMDDKSFDNFEHDEAYWRCTPAELLVQNLTEMERAYAKRYAEAAVLRCRVQELEHELKELKDPNP